MGDVVVSAGRYPEHMARSDTGVRQGGVGVMTGGGGVQGGGGVFTEDASTRLKNGVQFGNQ